MPDGQAPLQSPEESDQERTKRIPSVLETYAKDIDRYGKPLDSGLAEVLRFAAKRLRILAPLILTLALAGITFAQDPLAPGCPRGQHIYAPWFKQTQMSYLEEQPAHVCKICGSFQNSEGRFKQLVSPKFAIGGQGTLTVEAARAQVTFEVLADFGGSWDIYTKAKAKDGYGLAIALGGSK